ncbi:helix-turn-helix domain-containing protein [Sphingobacterium siyangense]|uniref:helix-turn-helix domain-containing protein n=1 Tax=Sphingobacterium siyangense TaxID=459529 RepID=UPI003C72ACF8
MEIITKQDLQSFKEELMVDFDQLLEKKFNTVSSTQFEWLRSKAIRKMMDISPAALQNLRVTGKIRYKKIMGSYYYNKTDLLNLFEDAK